VLRHNAGVEATIPGGHDERSGIDLQRAGQMNSVSTPKTVALHQPPG